jgi:peptidoglycan lytic transglycosylase D
MRLRACVQGLASVGLICLTAACGVRSRPATPGPAPAPAPDVTAAEPQTPADPIDALVATSQAHFEAGEREMRVGHLEQARTEFDSSLNVLLDSPYGARTEPRLRIQFDRLIERINAYEMTSFAQGDGFSEKKYEPASIDELLKIATFPKPPADAETTATVAADLAATLHDVPIPDSPKVASYVELFQGRLRDYITESLNRGSKYLPMIQDVFRAEGLPLDLAYIPIVESGFKTNALSRASAKGPWQFMRATAVEQGLRHDWFVDERSDPEKATIAAAKYLKTLYKLFDGDWHLVLAAYNGGLGRVQRAMRQSGKDDFWSLSASSRYLPRETREYVPLILAAIIVAKNPAQYGFEVSPQEPLTYDKVVVSHPVDLRKVAEWTGQSIDEVQALNPELRRWTTPVSDDPYELKVPAGSAERVAERLASAGPDDLVSLNWYTVRRGESLSTIARKLKVSRVELAQANRLRTNSRLSVGQRLVIPRAPAAVLASKTSTAPPTTVASRSIAGSGRVVAARRDTSATVTYRVKRGDTLSSIARLFNTTVNSIRTLNRISGSHIVAGDRLTIRTSR